MNADEPNPLAADTWLVTGFVVPVVSERVLPDATLYSQAAMQMSVSLTPQDAVIASVVRIAVVISAIQHSTSWSFVEFWYDPNLLQALPFESETPVSAVVPFFVTNTTTMLPTVVLADGERAIDELLPAPATFEPRAPTEAMAMNEGWLRYCCV